MIKGVYFDFGGVVSDETEKKIVERVSELFDIDINQNKNHLLDLVSELEKGKINEKEFWKSLKQKTNKKLPHYMFAKLWIRKYFKKVQIHENVLRLIKELKKNEYIVGLLSNNNKPYAKFLKKKGYYKIFNPVVLSCEVGYRKPEREIYEIALQKIELKPQEVVFVDDRQENVDAAKKFGIHAFVFKDFEQFRKDLISIGVKL